MRVQVLTMLGSKECAVNGAGARTSEMTGKDARIDTLRGCDAGEVPSCVDIPVGALPRADDIAANDGTNGSRAGDRRQFCRAERARPTNPSRNENDL
jgi:hypothetical protein